MRAVLARCIIRTVFKSRIIMASSGVEVIEARTYPQDYLAGHFVAIGGTGSGKTYYSKYLVASAAGRMRAKGALGEDGEPPVFVYVGAISAHDWTDPEENGEHLVPEAHIFTSWSDDSHRSVLTNCSAAGCGFVVFDDFKSALNYHTDTRFKDMFRAMRHMGVQLLAIGHTPNDVPPVVRDNVTHALLFFTSNREAIHDLANTYLSGDHKAISEAMRGMRAHAVFKINARANTRAIHSAPPPSESGLSTSSVGMHEGLANIAVGSAVEVSGRNVSMSGGTYNDASRNTQYLQLNQNIEAQVRQNQVTYADIRMRAAINREIDEDRVRHKARLAMLEEREELRGHLLNPWLTGGERDRAALLLARTLGDSTVTPYNLFTGGRDVTFMEAYYPQVHYEPRDLASAAVSTYAPLAVAAASGDRGGLVGEAFKAIAPSVAKVLGMGRAGGASSADTKTANKAARDRARALIVNRAGRRLPWSQMGAREKLELVAALRSTLKDPSEVDEHNYFLFALDLLKEFYPKDFETERRLAASRLRRT
jgi:hypothetical protein